MFVEPQEAWTAEDKAEFEAHASARLKQTVRAAVWAGGVLAFNIACIVIFKVIYPSRQSWEAGGKYLVLLAMGLFLWLVLKSAMIYSSWQSARETRREYGEPTA